MNNIKTIIKPKSIRLDASTVCQLRCPMCPTAAGKTKEKIGSGFLKLEDFKRFLSKNPHISHVELSNWGEIFLNKEILEIMEHAYQNNVTLSAANGANLNHAHADVPEALVKYQFRSIACSIDGACQESYSLYRRRGNFHNVIDHIKMINTFKEKYHSRYPELMWQFVVFEHNLDEIEKAKAMAEDLNMSFYQKLSWGDLYGDDAFSVADKDNFREKSGFGVSSREEYKKKHGKGYILKDCCSDMWKNPQINFDGRVLGCPVNQWSDYGNAFKEDLNTCLNNEEINYARAMLQGKAQPRNDIPCAQCSFYKIIKETKDWFTDEQIKQNYIQARFGNMIENKFCRSKFLQRFWELFSRFLRKAHEKGIGPAVFSVFPKTWRYFSRRVISRFPLPKRLKSNIHPLDIPLPQTQERWKPYFLFNGRTFGLSKMSAHVSSLKKGHLPHRPHQHRDEEVLLLLAGEADLIFKDDPFTGKKEQQHLNAGQFVYYPSGFSHTICPTGEEPANYLMFRWAGRKRTIQEKLAYGLYNALDQFESLDASQRFKSKLLFEKPTEHLKKLHCHVSRMEPGAGYDAHEDPYDVAIIVLEGEVETLGKRAKPFDVIFYAEGEPHGMRNPGDKAAQYIVFEFHGRRNEYLRRLRGFLEKIKGHSTGRMLKALARRVRAGLFQ